MSDLPKFDGHRVVTLLDGRMVFSDSEDWRSECEAREIARWGQDDRNAWLAEIERVRGAEAAVNLRKLVDEVISVEAARAR